MQSLLMHSDSKQIMAANLPATRALVNELTPGQNLETYLRTVQSIHKLTPEEEMALAEKLY